MFGCSVFTRPSRHSGKPVMSETFVTFTPACSSERCVPPVERISKPRLSRPFANSTTPVLSNTLKNALFICKPPNKNLENRTAFFAIPVIYNFAAVLETGVNDALYPYNCSNMGFFTSLRSFRMTKCCRFALIMLILASCRERSLVPRRGMTVPLYAGGH